MQEKDFYAHAYMSLEAHNLLSLSILHNTPRRSSIRKIEAMIIKVLQSGVEADLIELQADLLSRYFALANVSVDDHKEAKALTAQLTLRHSCYFIL